MCSSLFAMVTFEKKKQILDYSPLETDAPSKRHITLCDRKHRQSVLCIYVEYNFFLALYSVIYITDTFAIQIQNYNT